ncbi:hypothetical protein NDU88_009085 [Pleurodeles waltl]|uniref:Uncharacterized protein n=1 Tax=Pleurodeles waltl TaxID=8319 RepID=A0AAV7NXY5_PLEWA|nr:hypothetical protein NDU88_009085 [Pleurodeles waltl]
MGKVRPQTNALGRWDNLRNNRRTGTADTVKHHRHASTAASPRTLTTGRQELIVSRRANVAENSEDGDAPPSPAPGQQVGARGSRHPLVANLLCLLESFRSEA